MIVVTTTSVSAQPRRPERPYRGLFRGGVGGSTEQGLTLDAQLGGGYDDNVFSEGFGGGGGLETGSDWQSGGFGYLGADLSYSLATPRVSFGASLVSANRYFPDQVTSFIGAHTGRVGVSLERRRTRLTLSQSVGYQPFLTLDVFPTLLDPELGQGDAADQDQGTPLDGYLSYVSSVDLTHRVSRRGALIFNYGYRASDFDDRARNLAVNSVAGRYEHEVLRDLTVRLGYGFSDGRYASLPTVDQEDVRQHTIDVGVNFDRALSLTRRTTLSFETGGAAISDSEDTFYTVLGGARLNHEMGQSWNAAISYLRNLSFIEAIADPFLSDALSLGLRGMLARRLEFDATGSVSTGVIGLSGGGDDGLTTYGTRVGLTLGLTRFLALEVSHSYYHYAFESGVSLPVGLSSLYDRQSVLATLNVWVPIITSARSPNASR